MAKEQLTINELMSLMKTIRERVNSLKGLRQQVSILTRYNYANTGEVQRAEEPQYDVKKVDKKIMELENFLFKADSRIKTANARTVVELDIDVDLLLLPLE